ncbi:hypothetical protein Gpo141_00004884 [Globisporangium polare]
MSGNSDATAALYARLLSALTPSDAPAVAFQFAPGLEVPEPAASQPRSATGGTATASGQVARRPQKAKPRGRATRSRKACKPTYYVRKEEKSALLKEINDLKAQVEILQLQQRASGSDDTVEDAIPRTQVANVLLREQVVGQQYSLARLQSAHASYVSAQHSIPFQTHIHLGTDWSARQATLAAKKPQVLHDAKRYLSGRAQCLNASSAHSESSRYPTPSGDYCALRFEINQIRGATSVKQVYDALREFFFSMEISISEILGDITIREDEQNEEREASQLRYVSSVRNTTAQLELNCATFGEFSSDNGGFGVIATDFVDEDELYPYSPATRVRQDVTAALTVRPLARKKRPAGHGNQVKADEVDGLVVVLTFCCFAKLHASELPIPAYALQELRERGGRWGDLILKKLRDNLGVS